MTTKLKYSLNDLWNFSDKEILQILKYFKVKPSNPSNDRFEAIILSLEDGLLVDSDIQYVESNRFNKLFSLTDDQLHDLAKELGYDGIIDHIEMIKFIIDNDIKVVDAIPSQIKDKIETYQINKDLYVCGVGTFKIKDELKSLNGRWDPKNKCWVLPLIVKSDLLKLVPQKAVTFPVATQTQKAVASLVKITNPDIITQVHPDISIINQVPTKIPHNLQAYQIDNNILLCGKRTYDLKDDLKSIGSQFNGKYKCWSIPHDQIDYILDLIDNNKESDILEKEQIQQQKTLTRLKNLEEKNLIKRENLILQKRLDKEEPELPYVRHLDRLSEKELNDLKQKYSYDEIYDMMEKLDVKELKEIWDKKIISVNYEKSKNTKGDRNYYKYVTYTGNYRPSDQVLKYWANSWYPIPIGAPGYSVKRVDYKIYEILVWSTD